MAKQIPLPKQYPIPSNWCWVNMGKLVSMKSGFPFDSKRFSPEPDEKRPLIRIRDIVKGETETFTDEDCPDEYIIKAGEILIGMDGDFNVAKWRSTDALLNQRVCCIESNSELLLGDFLYYYLPDPLKKINDATPSVTVKHLSTKTLNQTPLPLPPLPEQQRIVDRIESIFAKLDEAKEKAQAVVDGFELRKSAILHQAFTGELTKEWRQQHNSHPNAILAQIRAFSNEWSQKDQRFLLAEQDKAKSVTMNNNHDWVDCTVGAIGRVTNGSTPSRKVPEYWNGDIPWVSSGEVKNNIIGQTDELITQSGYDNSSVKLLPIGTVLIAMIGEGKTRGQSSVLEIEATINQNIAAIVIDHGYINPHYLWYWFQMNYAKNREKGAGSGPQALNCQRVRELDFFVPNLTEQNEIVRILDDLLSKEQQAKDAAEAVLDQIDTMKKAILARAFRGELGTNDPKEESAEELLKGILA
jgi:type I restriction enzyme S subunit